MHIENEIKVLDIDILAAKKLLDEKGFVHQKDLSFKRYVYDVIPNDPSAWIRLRTDGIQTTLSYKQSVRDTIDGMKEIEVVVDNFKDAHDLLVAAGHAPRSYQENNRSVFLGLGCEVTIDSWPLIPAYMEIEATDKLAVENCLEQLAAVVGLKTTSLPTEQVYKMYGIDLSTIDKLTF